MRAEVDRPLITERGHLDRLLDSDDACLRLGRQQGSRLAPAPQACSPLGLHPLRVFGPVLGGLVEESALLGAAFGLEALELVQWKAGFLRVHLQKLLDMLAVVEKRIRRPQTRRHRARL